MISNTKFKLWVLSIAAAALLGMPKYSFAAEIGTVFGLTYRLLEGGGNRLELNTDSDYPYKEVEITVSKKDAAVSQLFEIVQRVGAGVRKLGDSFVMRRIRIEQGFPSGGHFDVQTSDITVASGRIYKSDEAGTGFTFTLVYGLKYIDKLVEKLEPGEYNFQINFVLKSIRGAYTGEIKQPLYVRVNVGKKETPQPRIEITTATGAKTIRLNSKKEEKRAADVIVKINKKFKKFFSIKQELTEPLKSNEGNHLDSEVVNIETREVKAGSGIPKQTLSSQPQVIYNSGPNGESGDGFIITYSLGDLSQQKAGRYRSNIKYSLEKAGIKTPLKALELEVENERIFDLVLTPQDQKSMIEFRDLKPREPPKTSEVTIEIKTNLGKQYQVSQNVYSDLTSKEGATIEPKNFTLRTEGLDTKGALKLPDKKQVEKGETVLFVSDNKGSPDKFKIIYELTCPWDIKAGDYSTRITYSLLEI